MTRLAATAIAILAVLGVSGCGVDSEDSPQPIEETSIQQPPATPSVDTEPATTPTSPPRSTTN